MTKLNTGQITQVRARLLLESLLDYVNPLADSKKLDKKLQVSWANRSSDLFVVCTVKLLVQLTEAKKDQPDLTEVQIKESIAFFENHLEILTRPSNQGSGEWRFTLKLWDTNDKNKNLTKFDELCQQKQANKQTFKPLINSSSTPAEAVVHSNQEHSDNLGDGLSNSHPSAEKLQKELTELRGNYKKLKDSFQVQEVANQDLKGQIKTASYHLTIVLNLLIIVIIPIEIGSGVIYDYVKDIYQKNNSSESKPANTNNSASNTSSSNFPDLFKQTNTASSKSQTEKPNFESKPEENFKCP
ncbi:hypothetical protein [Nostoc commune]|uniref:hypothetical protein n=1 Tax=Nostoc commune TaxID=1178 RepID=UPI0018C53635|nr:hypothetical protein [Nostoc commune]MBG1258805.1 hypothetical protein [Nostoc commune BAE]